MRASRFAATTAGVLTAVLLAGCASVSTAPAPTPTSTIPAGAFAPVLSLITQRLDTGTQVAASKWFSGAAIADPVREQAVLDAADAQAVNAGADRAYVAAVFADQISASKILQQATIDAWKAGSQTPPTAAPDLATQVRPILDRITTELVPALGTVRAYAHDPGCADAVSAAVAASARPSAPGGAEALAAAVASLCAR